MECPDCDRQINVVSEPFEHDENLFHIIAKCVCGVEFTGYLYKEKVVPKAVAAKTTERKKENHNKRFWEIRRETSQYNKYMKWHVLFYRADKTELASQWFKTEKKAQGCVEDSIRRGKEGFPIGNMMSYTTYEKLPA